MSTAESYVAVAAAEMLVISFCLLAVRVWVVQSVVWLSNLPRASKSHDWLRLIEPVRASSRTRRSRARK
jgi:hypothetical protein